MDQNGEPLPWGDQSEAIPKGSFALLLLTTPGGVKESNLQTTTR